MIKDTMTKLEVMKVIRKDFDSEVLPYYEKVKNQIMKEILPEAQRKKGTVCHKWISFNKTSNKIEFKILKRGDANGDKPEFIACFHWRKKDCVASLLPNGTINVFQSHCLDRYMERVLGKEPLHKNITDMQIYIDGLNRHILKHQNSAFLIVLPTPTHKYSTYLVMASALFLGDYEVEQAENKQLCAHWYNTCISLKECHETQEKIMHTLVCLQKEVLDIKYCPVINEESRKRYFENKKRLIVSKRDTLISMFSNIYMLLVFQRSFKFSFYEKIEEEANSCLTFLEKELVDLGIDIKSLNPFDKSRGVAVKGEIDYRG